jgi:hypothetical protein
MIQFSPWYQPTSISFSIPFPNNPIVVGNVLQNSAHSPDYSKSVFSVINVSTTSFMPGVFQSWPKTGINYFAISYLSTDYSNSPYILDFQWIGYPASIDQYGHGIITFSNNMTFPYIPTVVCTVSGSDGGHHLEIGRAHV